METLPLLGRILISQMFLLTGFAKVTAFGEQTAYAAQHGLPLAALGVALAAVVEIAGGLAILVGWRPRLAAGLLAAYLAPVTLVFHTDFSQMNQVFHFQKNLTLIGGLLLIAYFGAGPYSRERRRLAESIAVRQRTPTY